jgi:hypothetical protein
MDKAMRKQKSIEEIERAISDLEFDLRMARRQQKKELIRERVAAAALKPYDVSHLPQIMAIFGKLSDYDAGALLERLILSRFRTSQHTARFFLEMILLRMDEEQQD